MNRPPTILFLTDAPTGPMAQDLDILYPGQVRRLDFTREPHGVETLARYRAVVTQVRQGRHLPKLNYPAVTAFARRGGQVISCLFEYARRRGLRFSKTYVGKRVRPELRIAAETDVTRGFAVGDRLGWHGDVACVPDAMYDNQWVQRQILNLKSSPHATILATSTLNGGALIVEERVGQGRIVAMDLLSPDRPFFNSRGSANKYLFLGNVIGGSVRYGRHVPERLSYGAFVRTMRERARRYPSLSVRAEGACSDGRQMWSFNLGDARNPTVYLGAALHGWEWENAYGLMRLMEVLCENPRVEGLDTTRLHFKAIPVQNPYGFDRFVRQNARGVDLNRNFDFHWKEFQEAQDVVMPWDFDYKGARAFSEPESRIIRDILRRHRPVCLLDFHTADYSLMLPPKGDMKLMAAIHRDIRRRLKDRYLCQGPYGGAFQQANLDRILKYYYNEPYLSYYAAEQGVPASLMVELSGNRDNVQALVMNTDTVVEVCLAAVKQCLRRIDGGRKPWKNGTNKA